nr:MAG TPA: SOS-response transcriptional repressor [Caudoviricetes sp.]
MARELNMTRARLTRMLSGETELTFSTAEEIRSRYFPDRTLEYLFGEKDRAG